jgi:hypothetical protein
VLEIGAGCHLIRRSSGRCMRWMLRTKSPLQLPANCKLILSDDLTVPVPERRVVVAYSNQLMEHFAPGQCCQAASIAR